jgi:N-acetyl-anhydromuramyl-L-alanine amidase AmpD
LKTLRSSRGTAPETVIVPLGELSAHPSGLPSEWRPNTAAMIRDWQWIVVHHAAQSSGDAASIGRVHRDVNKWDGLGYHFVIGNGTQSGDGEIEVGFRWREQREGAHARVRAGDDNRWNLHGIGICLVGDFTTTAPSQRQMDALVRLVRALMTEYDIQARDVVPHKFVHGTECPGARFPWGQFQSRIR